MTARRNLEEQRGCATMKPRIKQLRILFLGNSYNPIGTVCLQTLVELGHEVIVGDYDPLTKEPGNSCGRS